MTTRLYTHPIYLEHVTPPGHPERPDRLKAIATALQAPQFDRLDRVEAPRGEEASILYAHEETYLQRIQAAMPETGIVRIDADTAASPRSYEAAMTAVGAANAAVDDVFGGACDNVF